MLYTKRLPDIMGFFARGHDGRFASFAPEFLNLLFDCFEGLNPRVSIDVIWFLGEIGIVDISRSKGQRVEVA
jgi:hypothetical protein